MTRDPRRTPLLEVCVEELHGIDAAIAGGADRLELCSALAVGGLTPPASLVRAAAASALPVHLLARPVEGGFVYDAGEKALIADDIRTAAEAGLEGVVIGALGSDRRLDADYLATLVAHARSLAAERGARLSLTLHRAVDLCADLPAALETAIALGFDRILTSGGTPSAKDALPMLAALHRQAAGRIIILPGSGISPTTLPAILETGVHEVHASCRRPDPAPEDPDALRFGFVAAGRNRTSRDVVLQLATMLRNSPLL